MSQPKDISVPSSTINYKSVISTDKFNVVHDIVISDFADWRDNIDFFEPTSVSIDVPISPDGGIVVGCLSPKTTQ